MTRSQANKAAPLVSVLVGAFHGGRHLHRALQSLLRQTYPNLQVIVINTAEESVGEIVAAWNRSRMTLVESREIPGKAGALNRGLQYAQGKYIAYLDDTAVFYPTHIARLVQTLEASSDCLVAYSDFYTTYYRAGLDGNYKVLAKLAEISRDFDRLFLCHFNHLLRVSMIHRRDLLAKTGPYNESVRVLVDWDVARRMAFFTDFLHVPDITGEVYAAPADTRADRSGGLDAAEYLKEVLTIRTARPAKPWPKMPDLSIIFAPEHVDRTACRSLRDIWMWTFVPYQVYLPLPADELQNLDVQMPNLIGIPVEAGLPVAARVDQALRRCEGDCVAVVPEGMAIQSMWVEPALHALLNTSRPKVGIRLSRNDESPWAAVLQGDQLRAARRRHPDLSIRQSVQAENIVMRAPTPEELPFQYDMSLAQAQLQEREGNWLQAARMYQQMHRAGPNKRQTQQRAARALYRAGRHDEQALALCGQINRHRPSAESLLLEARLHRRADRISQATHLLEQARQILQPKG